MWPKSLLSIGKIARKKKNALIKIVTFDSGFGGFLTAKAIEKIAQRLLLEYGVEIRISHFGDTAHAPYGEKSPEKIAELTASGMNRALDDGAHLVFIACNTASTQYEHVKKEVEKKHPNRSKDVISIIEESTKEVKNKLDFALATAQDAHFGLLATPATLKSEAYPLELARLYDGTLSFEPMTEIHQERWVKAGEAHTDKIISLTQKAVITLKSGQKINLYQLAPANWVSLIEQGADIKDKNDAVARDIGLLKALLRQEEGAKLDVISAFCTHYPIFETAIRDNLSMDSGTTHENTSFIAQGPIMARLFEQRIEEALKDYKRIKPLTYACKEAKKLFSKLNPKIFISGNNIKATKDLAAAICNKIKTVVKKIPFRIRKKNNEENLI